MQTSLPKAIPEVRVILPSRCRCQSNRKQKEKEPSSIWKTVWAFSRLLRSDRSGNMHVAASAAITSAGSGDQPGIASTSVSPSKSLV